MPRRGRLRKDAWGCTKRICARQVATRRKVTLFRGVYPVSFDVASKNIHEVNREVIDELTGLEGIVLATGGGAVLDPDNRRVLASRGLVVYLEASVEQQLERTRLSSHRPLLETPDPAERLASLMRQREPLYRELAALVVHTDGRVVREVAQEIHRKLVHENGSN